MRERENVESPDVLEMMMDFLAGLLSTVPTTEREYSPIVHRTEREALYGYMVSALHQNSLSSLIVLNVFVQKTID